MPRRYVTELPSRRRRYGWLAAIGGVVLAGCGESTSSLAGPLDPDPPIRASSLRSCGDSCDYAEACDAIEYDDPWPYGPADGGAQTGDLRCHRVCQDDGLCAAGERCVDRPIRSSDTGIDVLRMCVCADGDCAPATPVEEGGFAAFRPEASLPVDVYYHAGAAGLGRIFVSGGFRKTELFRNGASLDRVATIHAGRIEARGRILAWDAVGTLPEKLVHHATVVVGERLYVLGGEAEGTGGPVRDDFSARVWSASVDPGSGRVGSFRSERPLPRGRAWHAAFAAGSRIVVVGGSTDSGFFTEGTDEIWTTDLAVDGSLGPFAIVRAPEPLHYDGGSALSHERLYVLSKAGTILSTSVAEGIGAAPWREEAHRPSWRHGLRAERPWETVRAAAFDDALLFVLRDGIATSAPLDADGNVGPFRAASRIRGGADAAFAMTVTAARAYVTGGTDSSRRIDAVLSTERR